MGFHLRTVAEAAYEAYRQGTKLAEIAPFRRVLNAHTPTTKKLSCGAAFNTSTTPKSAPEATFDRRCAGFPRRFLTARGGRRGWTCLSLDNLRMARNTLKVE